MTFKGLKDYELRLSSLSDDIKPIAGKAIFAGAKIVADEVKENLNKLNTTADGLAVKAYQTRTPTYITERAKNSLIESFGVTPLEKDKDGIYNVKVGFDGYNNTVTHKYPKGQPNQLIARSVESGSTAMIKQPFMRKAMNASKKQAEDKMAEIIDEEIKKRTR